MALQLKKILISDEVDQKCVDILRENGLEVVKDTSLAGDKGKLIAEIQKYDGLIVRSATKVTSDVIKAAISLKIIGRAGTGVDNIDCDAATKQGIVVMNTPGGNTISAAELTCTMILAMSRHVCQGTLSLRDGRWERKKLLGNEVSGKTLAIVGLGRIGEKVAERMQCFGMRTIGYDPIIPGEVSAKFGVEWISLEDLWPQADYITVHTPLIPQTKDLLNDDVFSKCKKGVRIINCARGGIIDEDALLRALRSGQCGGAGLDVFAQEPPTNMELIQHPLVTCTPHLGANTNEAQCRVAEDIALQFVDAMKGRSLFGAINAQALSNALSPLTKPWVMLATALGKIAAATGHSNGPLTIETQGAGLSKSAGYLSAAIFVGLLHSESNNHLNLVSAPALAKKLQLKTDLKHQDGEVEQIKLSAADLCLVGTIGGATVPLLISINGQQLAQGVQLTGNMLLLKTVPNKQPLADIIRAVGSGLMSFVSSVQDSSIWYICQLASPLSELGPVKAVVDKAYPVTI
ncbi:hypothetical protein LSH36_1125g00008 [Paralvinella palmiformis]|uniref:D-3-phosphoglycerate dehydrogenase n=1 Tax=Paralvinella palmiformis TaxID=53620 RepID=A0AAD9IW07_9ANNE|nr:hypothetical protein LSH36_1125g00008 [Paralvinella palmiformis]